MNAEALIGAMFSGWTVVVALIFFGVVAWAFSGRRRGDFAAAAQLPLEADDDDRIPGTADNTSKKNR